MLVAFPPETARSLAQALSEAGWRQFHVAETEKYAHVTYFFNGGVEAPWPGEDRRLDPEPEGRDVRPRARDVGGGRHRRAGRGDRLGRLRLHRRELRQPGHGRPHRGLGRDDRGARVDRCVPRAGSSRRSSGVEAADPDGPGAILAITADHGNADDLRDADGPTRSRPTRSTPCRSCCSGGPWPAGGSPTGSSPTSRRRSSSSPACRPGRPSPVARCCRVRRTRGLSAASVVASAAVRTEDHDS